MYNLVSVVIPVYNGSLALDELCKKLINTLNTMALQYEIVLVDDNSLDDSWSKILSINSRMPQIKGIRLKRNVGQQHAVFCGLNHASGKYIITMDDDLQHNPEEIVNLYTKIQQGYDVVYGVAKIDYENFYRSLGSKLTDKLFNYLFKKPEEMKISSFRIMDKEIVKIITSQTKGYVYISAATFKITKNIKSIAIQHQERKYGNSNYHFLKLLKIFMKIYIYYSKNPLCKLFRTNKPIYEVIEKTY